MKRINRPEYLDFLLRSKDRQIIKVVSGIRRCGKSTIFDIYRDWLLENDEIGAGTNHNGIRQYNALEWLLNKNAV